MKQQVPSTKEPSSPEKVDCQQEANVGLNEAKSPNVHLLNTSGTLVRMFNENGQAHKALDVALNDLAQGN